MSDEGEETWEEDGKNAGSYRDIKPWQTLCQLRGTTFRLN